MGIAMLMQSHSECIRHLTLSCVYRCNEMLHPAAALLQSGNSKWNSPRVPIVQKWMPSNTHPTDKGSSFKSSRKRLVELVNSAQWNLNTLWQTSITPIYAPLNVEQIKFRSVYKRQCQLAKCLFSALFSLSVFDLETHSYSPRFCPFFLLPCSTPALSTGAYLLQQSGGWIPFHNVHCHPKGLLSNTLETYN